MDKREMLVELENDLKHFFCAAIRKESDKEAMEKAVERFIKEEASRYSQEELLRNFATQESAFKIFFEYLIGKGKVEIVEETKH